jgi:hypothetical protein
MNIDVLLLLALPAAGKSELRRYLAHLDPATAAADLHLGPTTQLDDYPYVHLMRRISEELEERNTDPVFFRSPAGSFVDPGDWGTLTQLINFDFADLMAGAGSSPAAPGSWFLDRIDRARRTTGIATGLSIPVAVRADVAAALDAETAALLAAKPGTVPAVDDTIVIEFSRGGPAGSPLPIEPPHGYQHALTQLSDEILARAVILYVWVTPEESMRRNTARSVPGRAGDASILHHGVPPEVMRNDYGTDDLLWLLAAGGGTVVQVEKPERTYVLPTAVFDNREDLTSFLRADPSAWSPVELSRLHRELTTACAGLGPVPGGAPNVSL